MLRAGKELPSLRALLTDIDKTDLAPRFQRFARHSQQYHDKRNLDDYSILGIAIQAANLLIPTR